MSSSSSSSSSVSSSWVSDAVSVGTQVASDVIAGNTSAGTIESVLTSQQALSAYTGLENGAATIIVQGADWIANKFHFKIPQSGNIVFVGALKQFFMWIQNVLMTEFSSTKSIPRDTRWECPERAPHVKITVAGNIPSTKEAKVALEKLAHAVSHLPKGAQLVHNFEHGYIHFAV